MKLSNFLCTERLRADVEIFALSLSRVPKSRSLLVFSPSYSPILPFPPISALQQPFLLPQDEEIPHGHKQVLMSRPFKGDPEPQQISPACIIPRLWCPDKDNFQELTPKPCK